MLVHTDLLTPTDGNIEALATLVDGYYHKAFYQNGFPCDFHAEGDMGAMMMLGGDPEEEAGEMFLMAHERIDDNSTEQAGDENLLEKYTGLVIPPFALNSAGNLHPRHQSFLKQAIERDLNVVVVGGAVPVVAEALLAGGGTKGHHGTVEDKGMGTGEEILEWWYSLG